MLKTQKAILDVTENAKKQVAYLLSSRGKESYGIRIGVKSGGCSGFKYYLEYADEKNKFDELIDLGEIRILIDPKAMMYLLGTKMDYLETEFKTGFNFINPNEKAKCGCGSSFSV